MKSHFSVEPIIKYQVMDLQLSFKDLGRGWQRIGIDFIVKRDSIVF